jgi:hypothetical protein
VHLGRRLMSALTLLESHSPLEWSVLAEVVLVMVGVSVEDERIFSAMIFIKNELRKRPRLSTHLECCARMKVQSASRSQPSLMTRCMILGLVQTALHRSFA